MTPSKASKEPEKSAEKEEETAVEQPTLAEDKSEEDSSANNNNSINDEDELIIKDELDNDCFEEVDRIGEIEKEVRLVLRWFVMLFYSKLI